MMKIMGAWTNDLFPCSQEEKKITLHVLKFEHPDMIYVFEKETQYLKTTLEQLDTKPDLIITLMDHIRGKRKNPFK